MPDGSKKELRCFCSRTPLLAVYGVDSQGRLYIHIKVWKQNRTFCEIVARGGELEIRCRECIRWHRIFIRDGRAHLAQVDEPVELQNEDPMYAGDEAAISV